LPSGLNVLIADQSYCQVVLMSW